MADGKFIIGAGGKLQIGVSGKFDICGECCEGDVWRPCGNEDDSGDIILPFIVKDEMGEDETVIQLDGNTQCYFWVEEGSGVKTEYTTVEYFADCDAEECNDIQEPCSEACAHDQVGTVASVNSAGIACPGTWTPNFGDGPYVRDGGGGVTDWQWCYAPPANGCAVLDMRCVDGILEARLVSRNGVSIFGDPDNAAGGYYKDVTANVVCRNGKLSGTFSLSILNALFCGGGAPGSWDTVTVTVG